MEYSVRQATAESIISVVGSFYDAAYGVVEWPDSLVLLADLFHGSRAWLIRYEAGFAAGHTSIADAEFHSPEAETAMIVDPLMNKVRQVPAGVVVRQSQIEELSAFYRRPLFIDWLRHRDVYFGLQAHLISTSHSHTIVDISHGKNQGDFELDDLDLLRLIAPHILRAGQIAKLSAQALKWPRGFEEWRLASLIVDAGLRVVAINSAAETLLRAMPYCMSIFRGRLYLPVSQAAYRLHAAVTDSIIPHRGRGGGVIMVESEDEAPDRRLVVSVAPLSRSVEFGLSGEKLALVTLRPVAAAGDQHLDEVLDTLFGLTPSQAKLARALLTGRPLRQIAKERGITYGSARTYLEQIYKKTGTNQQAALIALLKTVDTAQPD